MGDQPRSSHDVQGTDRRPATGESAPGPQPPAASRQPDPTATRVLLIGTGRLGSLIVQAAPSVAATVTVALTSADNREGRGITAAACAQADVAIDVSRAEAVLANVTALAAHGLPVVIGTTGWQAQREAVRRVAGDAGLGVVAAPNFSLGAAVLAALAGQAARLMRDRPEFGAFVYEQHHAAKRDAPSGTALLLRDAMREAGYPHGIDVAATRAGHAPGTHVVGFDGPAEAITLTHTVRDRGTFALGALAAARWVIGKHGWFSMVDVIDEK
jgi:4-hydroxy-tetrahydrodipicolinate reductase